MRLSSAAPLSLTRAMQAFQVMRMGVVVAVSVLLAKTELSTVEIGQYEMLLYWGTTLTFFWVSGLSQAMPPVQHQWRDAGFFRVAFLLFQALALLIVVLAWAVDDWLVPALTGVDEVPFIRLYGLFLALNIPTIVLEQFYLIQGRARSLLFWGFLTHSAYLLALITPVWMGYGLYGGISGLVVLAMLKWAWTLYTLRLDAGIRHGWQLAIAYLSYAKPLVANVLVGSLVLLFDSWLVGFVYQSEAVFAVYRYGSRELPLATALVSGLSMAMLPLLSTRQPDAEAVLRRQTARLMHLLFPLTIVLLFLTDLLFPLVFNDDLAPASPLFKIYLLLTATRVLMPNVVALAYGYSRVLLWAGLTELAVKMALGWAFIHLWGLPGLALSVLIAYAVEKLFIMAHLERSGIRTTAWLDLRTYLVYVAALYVAYAFSASL